jgi:hypothetical protein
MRHDTKGWRLGTYIMVMSSLVFLAATLAATLAYTSRLRTDLEDVALMRLEERGAFAANYVERFLFQEWDKVSALAKTVDLDNVQKLPGQFEAIVDRDHRFAEFTLADLSGKVLASSNSTLKNSNIADEPWFRGGLEGPSISSLHTDTQLAATLPASPDRSSSYLLFGIPVKGADGRIGAVLGAHIQWYWIRDLLSSLVAGDTQLLLFDRDRNILFAPGTLSEKAISTIPAFGAAEVTKVSRIETGPDGESYLTVAVNSAKYKTLPDLGWTFLVRQDAASALEFMRPLFQRLWIVVAWAAAITIIGMLLVAILAMRPLGNMARYAEALAKGENPGAPPEPRGCREAQTLAVALTALQSRLQSRTAAVAPPGTPAPSREKVSG